MSFLSFTYCIMLLGLVMVSIKCFLTLIRRLRQVFSQWGASCCHLRFVMAVSLIPMLPATFWTVVMVSTSAMYAWWFWLALHLCMLAGCILAIRLLLPWDTGIPPSHDFLAISVLFIVIQALLHNVIYVFLQIFAYADSLHILDVYENSVNNSSSLIWGCTLVVSVAWYAAEQQQRRQAPFKRRTLCLVAFCVVDLFVFDLMVQLSHLFQHSNEVFSIGLYGSLSLRTSFVAFWLFQERNLTNKLSLSRNRRVAAAVRQLRLRMGPLRLAAVGQALDILSLLISFPRYDFEILFIWMIKLLAQAFTSLGVIEILGARYRESKPLNTSSLTEALLARTPRDIRPPPIKKQVSWAPFQPVQNYRDATTPTTETTKSGEEPSNKPVDPSEQDKKTREISEKKDPEVQARSSLLSAFASRKPLPDTPVEQSAWAAWPEAMPVEDALPSQDSSSRDSQELVRQGLSCCGVSPAVASFAAQEDSKPSSMAPSTSALLLE
eukprot:gb/GEZN01006391.1/.p1 GENE.gb/GEZN01006391.1/~~gb/GEZN01006391.1/.p1  ORF type:complete len:530 (+),score=61.89 gb/GEZN01006391.1/:113-1591(+)